MRVQFVGGTRDGRWFDFGERAPHAVDLPERLPRAAADQHVPIPQTEHYVPKTLLHGELCLECEAPGLRAVKT